MLTWAMTLLTIDITNGKNLFYENIRIQAKWMEYMMYVYKRQQLSYTRQDCTFVVKFVGP